MSPIIRVESVSKVFRLQTHGHLSLRYDALGAFKDLLARQMARDLAPNEFYALKDVTFNVEAGETLGIIGRNGSGKTTLLRILSGIMRPSSGHFEVDGRFTSLISLGAGFINRLSGRDNIYLNAAFYGLTEEEVDEVIDQIIDFSEIGHFIDAPVKDYSSGMRSRLGFSIATNVLPDILFIDEILATGDEGFKMKSEGYLKQLSDEGRTVVVVSHNMAHVRRICDRAIWLRDGLIEADGDARSVIAEYRNL